MHFANGSMQFPILTSHAAAQPHSIAISAPDSHHKALQMHTPPAHQPLLPTACANRDGPGQGQVVCCFHPTSSLRQGPREAQQRRVPTLRLRCAGSDLQSRSMCSPTTTSGISPRLTGTGVLQRGHTGTCTSCTDKKRGLGAHSWATSSAVGPSLSLSGSACHGFHRVTRGLRFSSPPSKQLAVSDPAGATGTDTLWEGETVGLGDAQTIPPSGRGRAGSLWH